MKSGTCPRCQSREVFRHPGTDLQWEKVTLKPGIFTKATAPDR